MQSILGNTRKADIVFHSSGRIDITARVAKSLGLQHGDVVDIMLNSGEWYLYIKYHAPVYGRHEGMAYRSNARGNHFRVWSKALCNAILKECQASDKVKLCVSDPVDLYIYGKALPIIIKYILL
jgi:hypothetical protein